MNRRRSSNLQHLKAPLIDDGGRVVIVEAPKILVQSPSTDHFPFFDEDQVEVVRTLNGHDAEEYEKLDTATPLPDPTASQRCSALRRNSISMPTGLNELELELLRQQHADHPANIVENRQGSDSTSFSNGREESIEEINEMLVEEKSTKQPARNGRRKSSVMAALASRSPDEDSSTLNSDDDSPVNSITSINSLASLLKEKIQSIPSKIKKKPSDYKIKAFVGLLFLCIVFFVGFAYIMYHQQVLARAYFYRIKFNKGSRNIKISNSQGSEVLRGYLGYSFGNVKSYNCFTNEYHSNQTHICHEWLVGARLYMKKLDVIEESGNLHCYNIRWETLVDGVHPIDCFDSAPATDYYWYGGGQVKNMTWPLGSNPKDFAPFITGDVKEHQWGNALLRYFISSRGAAIIINDETPLYVSVNHNNNSKLCLKAMYDDFAFTHRVTKNAELNYNICTSSNIKDLHSSLSKQSLWDGLKEEEVSKMRTLLSEPIWHIAYTGKNEITESMIYNYTEDVIALGFLKQGHVLVDEHWQNHTGDLTLDISRFESLVDIINVIHRRGFKIVFSVQPFVSTQSINFAECVQKRLLVAQRNGDIRIPSLTKYKTSLSVGILDITNNRTVSWLLEKLNKLVKMYEIDGFYFDFGTAYDMPYYFRCERNLINPDQYKTMFIKNLESKLSLIGVSSAVSLPRPPIFVSLPPFESTWNAIKNIIPTVLSYGVIGYPFLMPGAVGGDIILSDQQQFVDNVNRSNVNDDNLPDKELYLRWLQLSTFLPVIKFSHLPSKYNDEHVLDVAKKLTTLRQETVTPLLLKYLEQALNNGLPLIRPLWMLEPQDSPCLTIDDEFSVGEELIVAPILEKSSTQREVYLPSGVWKDGIDGSLRKGSRWLHGYKVPSDKVAYFVKLPDDTRF